MTRRQQQRQNPPPPPFPVSSKDRENRAGREGGGSRCQYETSSSFRHAQSRVSIKVDNYVLTFGRCIMNWDRHIDIRYCLIVHIRVGCVPKAPVTSGGRAPGKVLQDRKRSETIRPTASGSPAVRGPPCWWGIRAMYHVGLMIEYKGLRRL